MVQFLFTSSYQSVSIIISCVWEEVKYETTLVTQRKEDQKQEALHWEVITTAL